MKVLSVCSGIEAATVAWHPLGWTPVAFSEIEKFPSAVLAHHYPDVPNWGDMTKFQEWPDADVDVLVGGTPCQSFSVAGLRAGLADPRGSLMLTYLAIARRYQPRWLVWENVPGVLSADQGRAFGSLLGGLAELGYGFAYRVLDAQYFGLAQRRKRVFVVGCLGDWRCAAAVLFERESLSGHPAPVRRQGQTVPCDVRDGVAGSIGAHKSGGWGVTDIDVAGAYIPEVAPCLTGNYGKQPDSSDTSRGPMLLGFAQNQRNELRTMDVADALSSDAGMKQQTFVMAIRGRDGGSNVEVREDGVANAILTPTGGRSGIGVGALMTPAMHVRRLTPRECERLQGFPDDYTLVPYRNKPVADGPRYKALGNSMATTVMNWIGRRIALVESITPSTDRKRAIA